MSGCAVPKRELFLLLYLTLTAVRVAAGTHFCDVANNALENCTNTCEEENQPQPVMPYIRCNHGANGSQ